MQCTILTFHYLQMSHRAYMVTQIAEHALDSRDVRGCPALLLIELWSAVALLLRRDTHCSARVLSICFFVHLVLFMAC